MKLTMMDYGTKRIDLSPPLIYPTGDIEADMEKIWEHVRKIRGLHPERQSDLKLRPSAIKHKEHLEKQTDEE